MVERDDFYFMKKAYFFAKHYSQNPKTNTGAVIVDKNLEFLSYGVNSFPNGIPYDSSKINPPEVYDWLEHAERNAICSANCSRLNSNLFGAIIYSPWIPCVDCAREIINYSLSGVIVHKELNEFNKKFLDKNGWKQDVALEMFEMAKVNVKTISGKLFTDFERVYINFRGEKFFP